MSEFKKGQPIIFTNARGQEKHGSYSGLQDRGPGKGGGRYLIVNVDGKDMLARPSKVRAA
ncbi:hypothetical protein SB18R_03110 [Pseudomonas oryzihabitans]|nr:hypothetical protein SB9_12345 [Pseudomonas psychrotolerans]KTT78237.1 hypothetical protein SB18R_03110 [Pseudomonas psychrotolerans]